MNLPAPATPVRTNPSCRPQTLTPHSGRKSLRAGWLTICLTLLTMPFAPAQEVLLGLTANGGKEGRGTAFSIKSDGANFALLKRFADWGRKPTGDTFTTLHSFAATDGRSPYGSLVKGADGSFYGMTYGGGLHNAGTAFRYVPGGAFTVLRNFQLATDGSNPRGSLTFGNCTPTRWLKRCSSRWPCQLP